ncbi:NUDIX domain-containing protein [Georgenia sp. Z1344]|uniref:NUDIX domain-containing protein n=1 Tax=Georgenia sp. Z1344 TaxID=3416706 RepID=UPI003CFA87AF
MHAELSYERSCRALLVDGAGRVLLVADQSRAGTVWAAPGGPAAMGEAPEPVLRRALHAATGLRLAEGALRDLAWIQHVPTAPAGPNGGGEVVDEVYLVRVPHFEPAPVAESAPAPMAAVARPGGPTMLREEPLPGTGDVATMAQVPVRERVSVDNRTIRWWSADEMTEAAGRGTLFSPRDLPTRLPALLASAWDMPVGEPATIHGY